MTLPLLNASPKLREAMKKFQHIKSKRQPKNLKGILTRAKFMFEESPDDSIDTKTSKCGKKSCSTCQFIEETSFLKFNYHLDPFKIRSKINCEAKDVIYALQCGGCEKQYIGGTGNVRAQVRLHKQHIFNPRYRTLYVSHNF